MSNGRIDVFARGATDSKLWQCTYTSSGWSAWQDLWPIARRKFDMLNRATVPEDLKSPPGNRLKHIGKLYAIRINDQFRITFKFEAGNTSDVLITDYH
ncbi:MAG TPA: type II toxin-antitoxin system RelE/ParE family toxin [Polyangiaceae bacterium]|nr:type II toxin-antitoxin system RelE/ParE family toxin [Polyangiaceae bacterium]